MGRIAVNCWRALKAIPILAALASPQALHAYSGSPDSLSGLTRRDTTISATTSCGTAGGGCHDAGYQGITVTITGPASLTVGTAGTYRVNISGSTAGYRMGALIAASDSPTPLAPISPQLTAGTTLAGTRQLAHSALLGGGLTTVAANGTAFYEFSYTMPADAGAGSTHTLYANARATDSGQLGGGWNAANNFSVTAVRNQTISFSAAPTPTYSPGGTFPVSATATSGLAVAYSSTTATVCSVNSGTGLVSILTAGTCTIAANQAGSAIWNPAPQVTQNVTIAKANQTITFGAQTSPRTYSPGGTFGVSPFATTTSGLGITYGSSTPGVCTVSVAGAVFMVSAGTCTITAAQAGNINYNPATTATRDVTISGTVPGAPTIGVATPGVTTAQVAFTPPANTGGTPILDYTATCSPAGSGTGAASPVTVTGLSANTAYTCSVTARNAQGSSAASGTVGFTTTAVPVFATANTTTFTVDATATPFVVSATGNPAPAVTLIGGSLPTGVTFTAGTGSGSLAGKPALGTVGGYPLTFQAANGVGTVTQSFTLTVAKAAQAIAFAALPGKTFGDAPVALTATGGASPNPVTFASTTTGVCTTTGPNGATLTIVGAGTCSVDANQAGDANYLAAPTVTRAFNVAKAAQIIVFPPLAGRTFGDAPFALSAIASSGLAVTFSTATTTVCTVTGATVAIVGTGTCTIDADQAGDANFEPAVRVSQGFAVARSSQAIAFAALPGKTFGDAPFTVSATGGASGNPVTFGTATTATVCTASGTNGTTITILAAGNCRVDANQAGNANYDAAPTVSRTVTVAKAAQAITFDPAPTIAVGGTGTVAAIGGGSGNPVTFTSTTPATCSVTGSTVRGIAAGPCTIAGNQAGGANHDPAPQATLNIAIGKGAQSIAFGAAPTLAYLGSGSLSATGGASTSPVTFASQTPAVCSVAGSTVTGLLAGTCTVTADQAGDANYDAAPQATQTFPIAKASQALTFGPPPGITFGGTGVVTATGGASGNPVTFTSLAPAVCTVAGATVTPVTGGTCTIAADQAGNDNYEPAPQATQSFAIGKASQAIAFAPLTDRFLQDKLFVLTASASSGLPVAYASSTPATCTVAGAAVTMVAAGPCTISADQPGDTSFSPAQQVTRSFLVIAASGLLEASPAALDFGGTSMNTTSPAKTVTFTNASGVPVTVDSVAASPYYAVSHDCGSLAVGASCTATVTFTPPAAGSLGGTLTALTAGGGRTVTLAGVGERSLSSHYYAAILGREPDASGKAYWDAEAARVAALGANVNEAWFAMASAFFGSPEYAALGRDDAGFVADLYRTFFNRAPDAAGLAYWTGQIAAGMPRDVVLTSFMFSTEFVGFAKALFGDTAAAAEIDTVMDFYRGFLARLPDDAGFAYWVGIFRAAACKGESAVLVEADAISALFAFSPEYVARGRSNGQFVADLYNAFLRRGGELAGVQFWIAQLDSGAMTRDQLRRDFLNSAEFRARAAAIVAGGCAP